ncbi:MAG: oligosaccharide flippase family protein [Alphaproteobacteria bacterium]
MPLVAEGRFKAMKDIFTSYFAQAIVLLANFVGGVLAARLLLPVGRGELGQVMLWPTLIAALGSFSINDSIIYFIASQRAEAARVIASALAIGAILSLILVLGGLAALPRLYAGTSPEVRSIADLFLLFIPLSYASGYLVCAFQADRRFALWNFLRVLVSCAYAGFAVAFWLTDKATVLAFAGASLMANLIVCATAAVLLLRRGGFGLRPDVRLMKGMIGYGAPLHLGNVLSLANQRLDQILVTEWLPAAQFGYYLVAISVNLSATGLVTLLGSLLFPKVAAAEDDAARAAEMGRYLRLALALSLGGGLLLLILAPWLIILIYGKAYHPTVEAAQVFAIGIAPTACKSLLGQAFKAVGRPRTIVAAELVALVTVAVGLVLLLRPLGILGAATAFVLAQTSGFAVLAVAVRRQLGVAPLALFTPSASDISFVARRLKDMISPGQEPGAP